MFEIGRDRIGYRAREMRTYKYKLKVSPSLARVFENTLELCRELYNAGLQERRDAWLVSRKRITFAEQSRQVKEIRKIRPDIEALNADMCCQVLRRLNRSYQAFFRRGGRPRFKSRQRFNSFTLRRCAFWLDGDRLTLSKMGSCRVRISRPIHGTFKTCAIKREANGWFAFITVEEDRSLWIPKTGQSVGVDVGLENFATLSTGEVVENPQHLRRAARHLRIAQRKVSKKKRGGRNRAKAIRVLARRYQQVANQRRDFCHKLSNQLIREFDEIAVEELPIKNLVKNRYLAKSISDAAWGTFLNILKYQAESAGRKVWKVPPQFTSQDCSRCGERVKKSLAIRVHHCVGCGLVLHRDHTAVINILARAGPLVSVSVS